MSGLESAVLFSAPTLTGLSTGLPWHAFNVTVGQAALAAGTAMSVAGAIGQGNAARGAANYQAAQLQQQAGQERATSQRQAMEERRRARFAQSRLQALAAASGAGATDPTVIDLSGDIAAEGEYRALTALFGGEERARGLTMNAQARRYEGQQQRRAGVMNAASTIMGGGYSMLDRFG